MPVDAGPECPTEHYEKYVGDVVKHVTAVYPELTYQHFNKLFTFAHGWTKSGELQVNTNLAFRNLESQIAVLWETFEIANGKLVLIHQKVEKTPWPAKGP